MNQYQIDSILANSKLFALRQHVNTRLESLNTTDWDSLSNDDYQWHKGEQFALEVISEILKESL